jgi:indole-3-glycerol phosphate synthase
MISESGITTRAEIDELRALGYDGFLIGETLMRTGDPVGTLEELGA